MRKIATLFITFLMLASCGDEVEFSTPAFQANKNYELWRAKYFNASLNEGGGVTITAGNNIETFTIVLPSSNPGTYLVSDTSAGRADFVDFSQTEYSTANTPDPSVTVYPEVGEIIIENFDTANNTITGTFRFIAFSSDGLESVGFNEGVFYKIRVQ